MTREEKEQIIDELTTKFADHTHFYITDAAGFTVDQVNGFRRLCYKNGVEYRVYKNTLIRKALEKNTAVDYTFLRSNVLQGSRKYACKDNQGVS
jgi:large subunit ribosomal protein L10